jgi:hypothetical protein
MRGSLLITFEESLFEIGGGYYSVTVNGQLRDLHYSKSSNLYSTFINTGDVISITVVNVPSYVSLNVFRRDYTTDDVDGNMGIVESGINSTTTQSPLTITFTATTLSNSYGYTYIMDSITILPTPTPTPTSTPVPPSETIVWTSEYQPDPYDVIYNKLFVYDPVDLDLTLLYTGSTVVGTPNSTYIRDVASTNNKFFFIRSNDLNDDPVIKFKIDVYNTSYGPFNISYVTSYSGTTNDYWGLGVFGGCAIDDDNVLMVQDRVYKYTFSTQTLTELFILPTEVYLGDTYTGFTYHDMIYNPNTSNVVVVYEFYSEYGTGNMRFLLSDLSGNTISNFSATSVGFTGFSAYELLSLYSNDNTLFAISLNNNIYEIDLVTPNIILRNDLLPTNLGIMSPYVPYGATTNTNFVAYPEPTP